VRITNSTADSEAGILDRMDEDPPRLRVLIADEDQRRIAEIAGVISGLGHTVVARLLDVSEIAQATQRETPDVAIVGVDGEQTHALDLISVIVKQAACPVIADIDGDDDSFIEKAARRGIFAYVRHGAQPEMAKSGSIGRCLNSG
jgi:AmiR/NasT family two-component response regulator